jgi:hypothetical protein
MKKLSIFVATSVLVLSPMVNAQTMDELARIVREAATTETRINQQREATFIKERNNQRNLLAQAMKDRWPNSKPPWQNAWVTSENCLVSCGRLPVISRLRWTIQW